MRIAIDIQTVIGRKTGIGKYTENLVQALSEISSSHQFRLCYFNFRSGFKGMEIKADNFKNIGIRLPGRVFSFLWKKINAPNFDDLFGRADIFHFPNFISRPVKSGKTIVTIHDLAFKRFPEYIEKKNLDFLNDNVPRTLAAADKIIAVSEFTKDELLKLYTVPEGKVAVIHEAPDEKFKKIEDLKPFEQVKNKYKLPDKFFLWVGTLEPRKNISLLLESFSDFKKRDKSDCKLVIVGKWGWNYSDFMDKLKSLISKNEVIFTEYVSDEDLPVIYNLAGAFIFPSVYEGFGLPPLEAMACGVPVVTTPALDEVVGEAAVKVSTADVKELSQAMEDILKNENLRKDLIGKGFKRAGRFSWERAARETLSLYEQTLKGE